jgi:hypothetical protein
MSIDDEISALEQRRDKCLANIDSRVDSLVSSAKSAMSVTHLVQKFPFAAVGAALSAGLLASGSSRKVWVIASHLFRSSTARNQRPGNLPPNADAASTPDVPEAKKGDGGKLWQKAAPLLRAAAPIILERIPWSKIGHSLRSRMDGSSNHRSDQPPDEDKSKPER